MDPEGGGGGKDHTRIVKSVNLDKLTPSILTGLVLLLTVYKPSPGRQKLQSFGSVTLSSLTSVSALCLSSCRGGCDRGRCTKNTRS